MAARVRISQAGKIAVAGAESAYDQLLNSIYDAVFITDLSGLILAVNERTQKRFLYEESELLGQDVLSVISGADDTLLSGIVSHLHKKRFAVISAECVRQDGSTFPAEISVTTMQHETGKRMCVFVRDLTVRNQAEKVLREALERLQAQDRARSALVANISHELRTPLTSMMYGVSHLLKGGGGTLSSKTREYLERFDSECRRLLGTVNDILDLTKLEGSAMQLHTGRVPLIRLVDRCMRTLELQAQHKGVDISSETRAVRPPGPEQPPLRSGFVECDASKMERVVINIVGNAIKYTPAGGRVSVWVEAHPTIYGGLVLQVEDSGFGISEEALHSVTDRYYRAEGRADGAGLGLSIAKEIVDMHDGTLKIVSPPPGREQGTRVSITLSATDAPMILVVEDDPVVRDAIDEHLGPVGYKIAREGYAGGALNYLEHNPVDMLIADLMLPGMDGVEMIVTIRGNDKTSELPIVVLTGAALDDAKREILSSFSIPIVRKPWHEDELLDAVDSAFAARRKLDK